jgi:uncharacterized Zn-binding protein involved in type VI secretion
MGRPIVVKGDPVRGTDTHNVTGTTGSPPVPYTGVADYAYKGAITDATSDFVRIGGTPVALTTSRSTLDPGETAPPAGGHYGPAGSNFQPAGPNTPTVTITDTPLGTGTPGAGAGSALLTVDGTPVLLDGDAIDTCTGVGATAGSTVTAQGQDFVRCSN